MQIINLTAENIKKLKAVKITPDGNVVEITGANDQGKTSILDCIVYALKGSKEIDKMPIRKGQDSAEIVLDLKEFVVKRTFTKKGSYLTITNKEGFEARSPQALLDKIVGKISFDPLAFIKEKDEKKQRQVLLDLVGVDLTDINANIQKVKAVRTNINQSRTRLKGELEKKPVINAPEKEVDVAETTRALEAARKYNQNMRNEETALVLLENATKDEAVSIADLKAKIKQAQEKIEGMATLHRASLKTITEAKKVLGTLELVDTTITYDKLISAQEQNKAFEYMKQRADIVMNLKDADGEYKAEGVEITALEGKKIQLLKDAKMPIEGLSVNDNGVVFNDIPISQASASGKLKIGMSVAMAQNPTLRVLRITDGSFLDSKNLKLVSEMVKDNDYQLWIERVDESGTVGIVIEDGMVKVTGNPAVGKPQTIAAIVNEKPKS